MKFTAEGYHEAFLKYVDSTREALNQNRYDLADYKVSTILTITPQEVAAVDEVAIAV